MNTITVSYWNGTAWISIKHFIKSMLFKPYLVCICKNFKEDYLDATRQRIKCKTCFGWMDVKRLNERYDS